MKTSVKSNGSSKPASKKVAKAKAPAKKAKVATKANRVSMFEQPITTVIRALAKKGWKAARAIRAMEAAKVNVSPATVRACVQNVRDKVGNIAELTKAEFAKLEKLAPKEA